MGSLLSLEKIATEGWELFDFCEIPLNGKKVTDLSEQEYITILDAQRLRTIGSGLECCELALAPANRLVSTNEQDEGKVAVIGLFAKDKTVPSGMVTIE